MKIIFFSLLFFLLPGLIFIKSSQFKESACSFIERWLIWIWISFSISSFYLFILASFGLFKTAIIITGWIFINLFLLLARFMSQIAMEPQYPNLSVFKQLGEVVVISIILLILVYLFFQPFEYILGGRDPGVYVNTGYMIAGQGGYRFQNDILAKLDNNFYYENGSIYPGFSYLIKTKVKSSLSFFMFFLYG